MTKQGQRGTSTTPKAPQRTTIPPKKIIMVATAPGLLGRRARAAITLGTMPTHGG
jgi:hypothetical protein